MGTIVTRTRQRFALLLVAVVLAACADNDQTTVFAHGADAPGAREEAEHPAEPAPARVPAARVPAAPPATEATVPAVPADLPRQTGAAAEPARGERLLEALTADHASVARIDLAALGLPVDLDPALVTLVDGNASSLTRVGGELRFVTPADSGQEAQVTLRVALPEEDVLIPVRLPSARPTTIVQFSEPNEAGNSESAPPLLVENLTVSHALLPSGLAFWVSGAPPLDPAASAAIAYSSRERQSVSIARYWSYDAASNQFRVTAENMQQLLNDLPASDLVVDVGLASADGQFAFAWAFHAHKPVASLQGQVVAIDGSSVTALAGRELSVVGLDNATRQVVAVQSDGSFSAENLVEGTYDITLLDVYNPAFWKATVAVLPGAQSVAVSLLYADVLAAAPRASSRLFAPNATPQVLRGGVDGTTVEDASIQALAIPAGCQQSDGDEVTYSVASSIRNSTLTCVVAHVVPLGTLQLGVELEVSTAEFPTFTSTRSVYNDTWSYAVSGLNGLGDASGSVNDSHATYRTVVKRACVDVERLARDQDYTFLANLAATNVGDGALATQVTLRVRPLCDLGLRVNSAEFGAVNARQYYMLRPLNNVANEDGIYISVPTSRPETKWGLALSVRYSPREANITRVRMGIVRNGQVILGEQDLSSQISSRSPGELSFKDVVVPVIATTPFSGKTNVVLELTGDVDNLPLVSEALNGVVMFRARNYLQQAIVPLFLAGDQIVGRRYGFPRDDGDDSWATLGTIQWLSARPAYVFNDITGLHAPQRADTRSVLDHSGHSDGAQIDIRYTPGAGNAANLDGRDDGKHILAVLQAARQELQASGATTNLSTARTWILANRALVEAEAPGARVIYVGSKWMQCPLQYGRVPIDAAGTCGAEIPGVGPWSFKPDVVLYDKDHLHHWHISLRVP